MLSRLLFRLLFSFLRRQGQDLLHERRQDAASIGCAVVALAAFIGLLAGFTLPLGLRIAFIAGFALFSGGVWAMMTPRIRSGYGHRARAARAPEPALFAAPGELPEGHCWQCGKPVPAGAAVCGRCGATRFAPPTPTVTIPEGDDLPPGTFARSKPAEVYRPGQIEPLT